MPALKFLMMLIALSTICVGCKPEVPFCESDDQCIAEGGSANVCVNGTCQECLEDDHCAEKGNNFFCNAGRCDPQPEEVATCNSTSDCKDGLQCFKGLCTEPIACTTDADCGAGAGCIGGFCEEGSPETLAAKKACHAIEITSKTQTSVVNFDFNTHQLSIDTRELLNDAAECLKLKPQLTIVIEGHCDERGTQEYNLALGEKRAQTVRNYLSNLGIPSKRMTTRSLGSNKPKCDQATEECHATNRRVEFIKIFSN